MGRTVGTVRPFRFMDKINEIVYTGLGSALAAIILVILAILWDFRDHFGRRHDDNDKDT